MGIGPLQPTLAVPVKVTLITVSTTTLGNKGTDVPVGDLVGDSDGVEIVAGAAADLERVCGIGTCVHVGRDRWIREAVCRTADSARWGGQVEAKESDGIPVVVAVAIFTDERSIVDGNWLVRCTAFQWGCCNHGGKGKTSEDLRTHFGFD